MSFCEKLKQLRESRNSTLQELANSLGITKSAVWKYEQNKAMPSPDILKKISVHFGVSADFLIFDEGERKDLPKINDNELSVLFDEIIRLEPKRRKSVISAIRLLLGKE
jgi:transcriptional regulator with XRE-family HTH domain